MQKFPFASITRYGCFAVIALTTPVADATLTVPVLGEPLSFLETDIVMFRVPAPVEGDTESHDASPS